jgi:riboflavin-specific deaminase-like protein
VLLRRLYPEPGELTPDAAVSGLRLAELAPSDRPYVVLNMVATVDGRAAIKGGTRLISSAADRAVFHHLRTQADAVMVGAGTLRAERYGRLVRDPALREKRLREGLSAEPLACLVSGQLELPPDLPLLDDPDSRVLVMTASEGSLASVRASIDYLRAGAAPIDLRAMLARLRMEWGVRSVLCEGGPTLNAGLLRHRVVDELFLTVAPVLSAGAEAPTIVGGPPLPDLLGLRLVWALGCDAELFLRYRLDT